MSHGQQTPQRRRYQINDLGRCCLLTLDDHALAQCHQHAIDQCQLALGAGRQPGDRHMPPFIARQSFGHG